jgi:hypothetical protein
MHGNGEEGLTTCIQEADYSCACMHVCVCLHVCVTC